MSSLWFDQRRSRERKAKGDFGAMPLWSHQHEGPDRMLTPIEQMSKINVGLFFFTAQNEVRTGAPGRILFFFFQLTLALLWLNLESAFPKSGGGRTRSLFKYNFKIGKKTKPQERDHLVSNSKLEENEIIEELDQPTQKVNALHIILNWGMGSRTECSFFFCLGRPSNFFFFFFFFFQVSLES
jgi:hypothetical protein